MKVVIYTYSVIIQNAKTIEEFAKYQALFADALKSNRISRVNAFDMLTCVNSCDSKPQSVGKKLRTSKNSDGFHGLGTKSIRTVAAKYKGEFDWSYSEFDRKFTVKIAFSRTDKESANG